MCTYICHIFLPYYRFPRDGWKIKAGRETFFSLYTTWLLLFKIPLFYLHKFESKFQFRQPRNNRNKHWSFHLGYEIRLFIRETGGGEGRRGGKSWLIHIKIPFATYFYACHEWRRMLYFCLVISDTDSYFCRGID